MKSLYKIELPKTPLKSNFDYETIAESIVFKRSLQQEVKSLYEIPHDEVEVYKTEKQFDTNEISELGKGQLEPYQKAWVVSVSKPFTKIVYKYRRQLSEEELKTGKENTTMEDLSQSSNSTCTKNNMGTAKATRSKSAFGRKKIRRNEGAKGEEYNKLPHNLSQEEKGKKKSTNKKKNKKNEKATEPEGEKTKSKMLKFEIDSQGTKRNDRRIKSQNIFDSFIQQRNKSKGTNDIKENELSFDLLREVDIDYLKYSEKLCCNYRNNLFNFLEHHKNQLVFPNKIDPRIKSNPYSPPKEKMIFVQIKELNFMINIEPMLCTLYLYDFQKNQKISEDINFLSTNVINQEYSKFIPSNIHLTTNMNKCIFKIPGEIHSNIYFVFRVNKILQGPNKKIVEPYLKSIGTSSSKVTNESNIKYLKALVEDSFLKYKKYYQPFCWSIEKLFDRNQKIYRNESQELVFKNLFIYKSSDTNNDEELYKMLSNEKKDSNLNSYYNSSQENWREKLKKLPGDFKIKIGSIKKEKLNCVLLNTNNSIVLSTLHNLGMDLKSKEVKEITLKKLNNNVNFDKNKLAKELCNFESTNKINLPNNEIYHNLFLNPMQFSFNYLGKKNVLIKIIFKDNDQNLDDLGLPVFYSQYLSKKEFSNQFFLNVRYNSKSNKLFEQCKIKLPSKILPSHHFLVKFIHVNCKQSKKNIFGIGKMKKNLQKFSGQVIEETLGFSVIPLINNLGIIQRQSTISIYPYARVKSDQYFKLCQSMDKDESEIGSFTFNTTLKSCFLSTDPNLLFFLLNFSNSFKKQSKGNIVSRLKLVEPKQLIKFFPIILNILFKLIIKKKDKNQQLIFNILIFIVNKILNYNSNLKFTLIRPFIDYYFSNKIIFIRFIKLWNNLIEDNYKTVIDNNINELNITNFLLTLIYKSMVLYQVQLGNLNLVNDNNEKINENNNIVKNMIKKKKKKKKLKNKKPKKKNKKNNSSDLSSSTSSIDTTSSPMITDGEEEEGENNTNNDNMDDIKMIGNEKKVNKKVNRSNWFNYSLKKNLRTLINNLVKNHLLKIDNSFIALQFNESLSLFFKDLLSIYDRGEVFQLIEIYLKTFEDYKLNNHKIKVYNNYFNDNDENQNANNSLYEIDSNDLEFYLIKILSNYEFYNQINLPIFHIRSKWKMNITTFSYKKHFLSSIILRNLTKSIINYKKDRGKFLKNLLLFKELLINHNLIENQNIIEQNLIIYLPFFLILIETKNKWIKFRDSDKKSLLLCFIYLIQNIKIVYIRQWWLKETYSHKKLFFSILRKCLDCFNYLGKKKLNQQLKKSFENDTSYSNDYYNYSDNNENDDLMNEEFILYDMEKINYNISDPNNVSTEDKGFNKKENSSSKRKNSLLFNRRVQNAMYDSKLGSAKKNLEKNQYKSINNKNIGLSNSLNNLHLNNKKALSGSLNSNSNIFNFNLMDHEKEGKLCNQVGLIILNVLQDLVLNLEDWISNKKFLIKTIFQTLLKFLQNNTSNELIKSSLSTIRIFFSYFRKQILNSKYHYFRELCYLIIMKCVSPLQEIRTMANGFLFLILKESWEEQGTFEKTIVNITISFSKLGGDMKKIRNTSYILRTFEILKSYSHFSKNNNIFNKFIKRSNKQMDINCEKKEDDDNSDDDDNDDVGDDDDNDNDDDDDDDVAVEKKNNSNNNSSNKDDQIKNFLSPKLFKKSKKLIKKNKKDFYNKVLQLITSIKNVLKHSTNLQKYSYDPEMVTELYIKISSEYSNTPELHITWLDSLVNFHLEKGNITESGMVVVHIAAYISEILYKMYPEKKYLPKGIKPYRKITKSNTSIELTSISSEQLKSLYSNSTIFNIQHLGDILRKAITLFKSLKLYEYVNILYKVLIKIWENEKDYNLIKRAYEDLRNCYEDLSSITNHQSNRMFVIYYRIKFFGKRFGEQNNKEYIYRQPPHLHLLEFSKSLVDRFSSKYKSNKVQIIQKADTANIEELDKDQLYLQITKVDPYFTEEESQILTSDFEKNFGINKFFFDVSYTTTGKMSEKIEEQGLRRHILYCKKTLPNLSCRALVKERKIVSFNPIQTSTQNLKRKTKELKFEIKIGFINLKKIQAILQGVLLTTVNVGPFEILKVFLGENKNKFKKSERKNLQMVFQELLTVLTKATELNEEKISNDQVLFQDALKKGLKVLDKISQPYLQHNLSKANIKKLDKITSVSSLIEDQLQKESDQELK
ncbi:dedicator of cytokinesis dock [Anaeramoeba flamelloides]|uniref:Dedicator of cytokinesis dock n=1 Tax=Anaeramoeba flamelloides TaxID=1746091 RepID=A0AAV7YK82_9EUKA|nr:dedicator of cytokinesis dock [Anaeramoeba flamelloides]